MTEVGRDLLVAEPVIVEGRSASAPGLLRRAVELDSAFADLDLGYVDAAVMAIAERDRLAVLTFDFEHFRATRPDHGYWQLVVDEHRYQTHTRS